MADAATKPTWRKYTAAEDAAIRGCTRRGDLRRLAAMLGRTYISLDNRARHIGARLEQNTDWVGVRDEVIRLGALGWNATQIAAKLGISRWRVKALATAAAATCPWCSKRHNDANPEGLCPRCLADIGDTDPPAPTPAEIVRFEASYAAVRKVSPPPIRPAREARTMPRASITRCSVTAYRKAWAAVHRPDLPWGVRRNGDKYQVWLGHECVHHGGTNYETPKQAHAAAVALRDRIAAGSATVKRRAS